MFLFESYLWFGLTQVDKIKSGTTIHKNMENSWMTKSGLTHWGRVTHICVSKLTIIGSDNGLSPDRRQAIIWTNAGILLILTLGTNFSEIRALSFKKMELKMASAKWRPFCLGLNVLITTYPGHRQQPWHWMWQAGSCFLNSWSVNILCHEKVKELYKILIQV